MIEPQPLGIEPEWIWRERRATDLLAAINRYMRPCISTRAAMNIKVWGAELAAHSEWLAQREAQKSGGGDKPKLYDINARGR